MSYKLQFHILQLYVLQFHVLHFRALQLGLSFSYPLFSAPPNHIELRERGELQH